MLARRLEDIKPSPTLMITAKAAELKAKGVDIISLGAGEPDFSTPQHIKDAGIEAINTDFTRYTAAAGIPELKKAIQNKFLKDNNASYELSEICISNGAKQVLFNAFMATLNPGDEVIIPAPYWVSYPDMVKIAEGTPVIVSCSKEANFKITPEALEKAITQNTKWLILNSPGNPTGSVYSKEELLALLEVVEKNPSLHLLVDDIYEHITYAPAKFVTPITLRPDLKDQILTVNGVSKAYSMTGWRIGYAAGREELIKAMTKLQSQSASSCCSISQYAAVKALEGDHEFLKEWVETFCSRRDFVVESFNNTTGLSCLSPEGAFYAYVCCQGLIGKKTEAGDAIDSDTKLAEYFLEEASIAVVPGAAFGLSPYFRVSYATSLENLQEACKRISAACDKLI